MFLVIGIPLVPVEIVLVKKIPDGSTNGGTTTTGSGWTTTGASSLFEHEPKISAKALKTKNNLFIII